MSAIKEQEDKKQGETFGEKSGTEAKLSPLARKIAQHLQICRLHWKEMTAEWWLADKHSS